MPVYRAKIPGAKPVLVRDSSKAKALDQIVTLDALTGEELADALESGEKIWKAGDQIQAEAPDAPESEAEPETRVNIESGMVEKRGPGEAGKAAGYVEDRPATIAELIMSDPMAEEWRVDPKGGLVQRLPKGADTETGWQDIRAATAEEITAAGGKPKK